MVIHHFVTAEAKKKYQKNELKQKIEQNQKSKQSSTTVGLANILSGNNVKVQSQVNTGSNVGVQSNN
jgi:hypothetical protein